jgi:hypothetical protein
MNKDPFKSSSQPGGSESAEVSKRKTALIAMLNDINPGTTDFASGKNVAARSLPNESYDILTLALSDAIHGKDITIQHPQFYENLLTDPLLRQAFLDTLHALDADEYSTPLNLLTNAPDLSFLDDNPREQETGRHIN